MADILNSTGAESNVADTIKQHWDQVYDRKPYLYGQEPNAWLAAWSDRFPKQGKGLALADGYGRNGVFIAECGLDVLSLDLSPTGVEQTKALAQERGVPITALQQDVSEWQSPGPIYDVVALIYAHFSSTPDRDYNLRRNIHRQAAAALKPGGLLILEAFSPDQLGKSSGGPKMPHYLYTEVDMRNDFKDLALFWIKQQDIVLAEGSRHRGLASVVRLVATK